LQSVAKEERRDSPASIESNASSTVNSNVTIQHNAFEMHKTNAGRHQSSAIPSTSHVQLSEAMQVNANSRGSPMSEGEPERYPFLPPLASSHSNFHNNNTIQEGTLHFPSLQTSRLCKLTERDEETMDNHLNSTHTLFTSTFDPSRDITQRNNFFDESPLKDATSPMLLNPLAMDIDSPPSDGNASCNSSIISTSPGRTIRFRPRTSPNPKRNKVSSSF